MKEKINFLITLFTRILTAIIIFDSIMQLILSGSNAKVSVIDLLCLIAIALLDTLMYIPFLADKDFSKTQWVIMNVLYFLGINITTVVIALLLGWINFTRIASLVSIECVIICTYSLVMIFFYKVDASTADKMNKKLKEMDDE